MAGGSPWTGTGVTRSESFNGKPEKKLPVPGKTLLLRTIDVLGEERNRPPRACRILILLGIAGDSLRT
jgi:hypothetical protein